MSPQESRARATQALVYARMIRQMRRRVARGFTTKGTADSHIASYWGTARYLGIDAEVGRLLKTHRRR